MVDLSTGQANDDVPKSESPASEFARMGGLKGGKAAAQSSPVRRREIAKISAQHRWTKDGQ
jgi:hypothetical protein